MKTWHFVVGGVTIIALALMSFAKNTGEQLKRIAHQMQLKVVGVRKIDIVGIKELRATVDIALVNPTSEKVDISTGGVVKGLAYRVLRQGRILTSGTLGNFQAFNIQPGGMFVFRDIGVRLPILELGKEVFNLIGGLEAIKDIANIKQRFNSIDFNKYVSELSYEIDVEILGLVYTFRQHAK